MGQLLELLLVEDDPGDADLIQEFLATIKPATHVNLVEDGVKALAYLRQQEPYTAAVKPDLIILDLNLPRKNGFEVLREVKQDKTLKRVPVIILTTSDMEEDIIKSYEFGANCYVSKPIGLGEFAQAIQSIETFWFTMVKLPRNRD